MIVFHSRRNLIQANVIARNRDEAILMEGGHGFRVQGNRVRRNGGGITLGPGSGNVIAGNRVLRGSDGMGSRRDTATGSRTTSSFALATAVCGGMHTGANQLPTGKIKPPITRCDVWSARFTRERSVVRNHPRPWLDQAVLPAFARGQGAVAANRGHSVGTLIEHPGTARATRERSSARGRGLPRGSGSWRRQLSRRHLGTARR
jgi:parallel beta-helix repeat protein